MACEIQYGGFKLFSQYYILNNFALILLLKNVKTNVHELIFLFLKIPYHDDDDDYDYCVGKQRQVNHPPVKQSIMNKHYYTYTSFRYRFNKTFYMRFSLNYY